MLRRTTIVAAVLAATLAAKTNAAHLPQRVSHAVATSTSRPDAAPDRMTFRLESGKVVEILKGAEALSHLKNLQARRAERFARASERLRARGWKPTEHALVIRTTRESLARRSGSGGIEPVQTVSSDEGEVVFWSWDDGDDGTWEGEMWAQRYSDGAEALTEGQTDIRTNDHYVLWEELTYWQRPSPEYQQASAAPASPPIAELVSLRPISRGPIQLARMKAGQFIRDWLSCTLVGCGTSAWGCGLSGPAYIECVFLMCHVSSNFCAVSEIIKRL